MQYQFLFNSVKAFKETKKGISFSVKVKPNAKVSTLKEYIFVNEVVVFKVDLKAPPLKGKANKELLDLLSQSLGVDKSAIFIKGGLTDKNKVVEILKPYDEQAKTSLNKIINQAT